MHSRIEKFPESDEKESVSGSLETRLAVRFVSLQVVSLETRNARKNSMK